MSTATTSDGWEYKQWRYDFGFKVIDRPGVLLTSTFEAINPPRPKPASEAAFWASVAGLFIVLWLLMELFSTPSHGGEVRQARRTTRITVLKPIRAQGRAHAGYPFLQTTANTTRVIANVTGLLNPIGWFLR